MNRANYLDIPGLAEELGICVNSAYALVHKDGFPALKVGKRYVIPRKELSEWITDQMRK